MKGIYLVAVAAFAVSALPARADFTSIDRQLFNITSGYDFDADRANHALSAGADINARNEAMDDQTMLILAIKSFAKPEVIQWLLAHGADASIRDAKGKTALDWAMQYGIDRHPDGHRVVAENEFDVAVLTHRHNQVKTRFAMSKGGNQRLGMVFVMRLDIGNRREISDLGGVIAQLAHCGA